MTMTVRTFLAPSVELRAAFLDAQRDYASGDGRPDADGLTLRDLENGDFARLVEGIGTGCFPRPGVRPGAAGMELWWCETAPDGPPRMLGRLCMRHYLVPALEGRGGQVWVSIRPSRRGEGLGAELLRDALPRLRAKGLDAPTVVCPVDHAGARVTVERVGGVLVREERGRAVYTLHT
nr:hypothetical protein GCM10010200_036200 [Actinomadura rugatobispora]